MRIRTRRPALVGRRRRPPGSTSPGLMAVGRDRGAGRGARPGFRPAAARWPTTSALAECSMGMTDDLEVAVEEGSTMVRVGTALFGPRAGAEKPPARGTSELTSRRGGCDGVLQEGDELLGSRSRRRVRRVRHADGAGARPRAPIVLRAGDDRQRYGAHGARRRRRPRPQGAACPAAETEQPSVTVRARTGSAVRTMPAGSAPPRPYTVRPTRFDHAQEVADNFKEGVPVIVNLQDVNKDLAAAASSTSAPGSPTASTARWTRWATACTSSRRRTSRCHPRTAAG